MKNIFLTISILSSVGLLFSCKNKKEENQSAMNLMQIEKDSSNFTTIQWLDSLKDFGTAKFGGKVSVEFKFKNVGQNPLYLTSVHPSCGCTVADYTKGAILPGNEGFVNATYDTNHGTSGSVHKNIIVASNTFNDNHFVLSFTGQVVK